MYKKENKKTLSRLLQKINTQWDSSGNIKKKLRTGSTKLGKPQFVVRLKDRENHDSYYLELQILMKVMREATECNSLLQDNIKDHTPSVWVDWQLNNKHMVFKEN